MELNAETRSVANVFTLNKKYVVPRFQREYSWQADQLEEFWEDITQQIRVNSGKPAFNEYFIGAVVLVGDDSKSDYLIVDGQQRLTTLTILLRAIVERLNELKETKAAEALHKNVIQGVDHEGNEYFKLINESPKPYFQNEVQALEPQRLNAPKSAEEMLLSDAYQLFRKRVGGFKLKGISDIDAAKALRDQTLDYLKFIQVTAKNEDDAYTIFETLNARGISLSSVDLVKNWIFKNYPNVHPHDNAKEIWSGIRKKVSNFSSLEVFFRHYWNARYAFASDDRLYKSFKDVLKKKQISGPKDFLLELQAAAETYRKIGAPRDSDWRIQKERPVKRSLSLLGQYKVTQPRPFLIALLECRRLNKSIPQTLFVSTVRAIENFHFVFSNVCQERASGLEGKYTRAAKQLYAAGADKTKAENVIKKLLTDLRAKRPDASKIKASLTGIELTDDDASKKQIQTIFHKIEAHRLGTSELEVAGFSLEHIDDHSNGAAWCNQIGNLLPLDEKLNNAIKKGSDFIKKKSAYSKSQLRTVADFLAQNPQGTWGKADADRWCTHVATQLDAATRV
jgi:hypothetical protein